MPTKQAIGLILLSLLVWCSWELARPNVHPYGSYNGLMTDHFSHMNAARLFPRVGADIWRRPIRDLLRPAPNETLPTELASALRGDRHTAAYEVPGWPAHKPLIASWTQFARPYPPGDLLLVAPIAVLYHDTSLSFTHANQLLIVLFLAYAHVALYLFLRAGIGWLALAVVYPYILYHTLNGFYDAAALVPLLLCRRYLGERRGLAALVAYSAAVFIHYRSLFFAPWAIEAFLAIHWSGWRARQWLATMATVLLAAGALIPLWLIGPTLAAMPINNPVHFGSAAFEPLVFIGFCAVGVAAAVWFILTRAWSDLLTTSVLWAGCLSLHQAYDWHVLIFTAWLASPRGPATARLLLLAGLHVLVFCWFMIGG